MPSRATTASRAPWWTFASPADAALGVARRGVGGRGGKDRTDYPVNLFSHENDMEGQLEVVRKEGCEFGTL
ncbi:hypothetical protein [Streptomyces sp. 7N604]|uniref:hypothetical protein n=1 Tax=Streptomyces sp. 7N604 TaxID=3457415 RepID=UPI003FCF9CF3